MTAHDPLCPSFPHEGGPCEVCDLIARIRADAIHECIAVVEALPYGTGTSYPSGRWLERDERVLPALRALLSGEES